MEKIFKTKQLKLWIQAARPFSLPASIIPMLVGGAYAYYLFRGNAHWWLFPLIFIAGVMYHAATNIVSDYFDYIHGVDREDTYGGSRVLVDKLLQPKELLYGGYIIFGIGTLIGLFLVTRVGYPLLIIGLFGLLGGIFYTAKPVAYKYKGWGDFAVFLFFGILMVLGTFYTLTESFNWNVIIISIPVGLLISSILNANNIRDIKLDKVADIDTTAHKLGYQASKNEYICLVSGAFISIIIFIILGILEPYALLVFLVLPQAFKNMKDISVGNIDKPEQIAIMDVRSAQLHMKFGLLLTAGIIISALL
ncbi:MAG TPA: 1,4-dihydroxy-2-naphthoate octaprenyltransferase [Bacteroidota bacterium]|nr:1,4-dihydroxy-2-naphthoate octaprenyltransferase [Bacteroidota bacterium]